MTKNIRILLVMLVFGALSLNNVYGQNKNALFLNIGSPQTPILTDWNFGLGYERSLNKNFSALFTGDYAETEVMVADAGFGEERTMEMNFLAHLRYYPLNFAGDNNMLFFDAGAGYTLLALSTTKRTISNFLKLQAELGWKFTIYRMFLQPWLGYNISFGKFNYPPYLGSIDFKYREQKYGYLNFGFAIGFNF